MKIASIVVLLLISVANADGIDPEGSKLKSHLRGLKKSSKSKGGKKAGRGSKDVASKEGGTKSTGGGAGAKMGGATTRTDVDDTSVSGAAGPQPAIGNRAPGCPLVDPYKPTYTINKHQDITLVPAADQCECNDQCAFQDGNQYICCLFSHFFRLNNDINQWATVCVDYSNDITAAILSHCLVGAIDDGNATITDQIPVL